KNINIQKLSKIFTSIQDPDYELISSDDEIYLNQLIEPNDYKNEQDNNNNNNNNNNNKINLLQDQIEPIDADYILIINDDEPIEQIQQQEPEPVNDNLLNDDRDEPAPTKRYTKNQQRSVQARHRKNHRRNRALKKRRYYYSIKRKWYPYFPKRTIRKILRIYNINYTHVREDGENLLIGLKNQQSENIAEHQLPRNIFNRQSYFYYRKLFRR
ncbi:unnamed protein product, partial [Rotaria sordida]